MNLLNKIKPLLITLSLCCAAPLSAAEPETAAQPVPWHVPEAVVRVPVTISPGSATRTLGLIPTDVYLSELKPIKADGLTFVPETTNSPVETKKRGAPGHWWHADLNGTATYALKPEYTHFTCWLATEEGRGWLPLTVSFDEGKTFVLPENRGEWGTEANARVRHLFDRTTMDEIKGSAVVYHIPPGSKTITLKYSNTHPDGRDLRISIHYKEEPIVQAGFLTRRPSVASVDFQLPALDLAKFVPLVHTASGKRVGCRALWANLGEPMVLQFDYSSRESHYYVYLVERSTNPPPLAWEPNAGVVMESRLAKSYDPAIQTVAGFRELWAEADDVLGRDEVFSIWGYWFPFRPTTGTLPRYRRHSHGDQLQGMGGRKHLALSTLKGTFHVPHTGRYEFLYSAEESVHFLIDGKLVSRMGYNEARAKVRSEAKGVEAKGVSQGICFS